MATNPPHHSFTGGDAHGESGPGASVSANDSRGTPQVPKRVTSGALKTPGRKAQYSAETWEHHREDIERLYIHELRTLKEVASILSHRGLRATPKMFKIRLKQWGLIKNNVRRKDVGNESPSADECAVAGPLTNPNRKANILFARTGSTGDYLHPHGVRMIRGHNRPRHASPPISLNPPDTLRFREAIVSSFEYLLKRHYALDPSFYRGVIPFMRHILSEPRQAVNDLIQSSWLFGEQHIEQAGLRAKRAFFLLLDLLHEQNFYSLIYLFISIPHWRDPGLLGMVWNCLAANASERGVLGPSPNWLSTLLLPMRQFYRTQSWENFSSHVSGAMGAVFQLIEDVGNKDDFCTIWLRCDYTWSSGLEQKWIDTVQNGVLQLRSVFNEEILLEDAQRWSQSMSRHLQTVRRRQRGDDELGKMEPEMPSLAQHEDVRLEERRYGSNEAQVMCLRTVAQYHEALRPTAGLGPVGVETGNLGRAPLIDEAEWAMGQIRTMEEVRGLEVWYKQARVWEEVEAAKAKWVCGMWLFL